MERVSRFVRRAAQRVAAPRELQVAREARFLLAGRLSPLVATDTHGDRFILSTTDMGQARLTFMHGNRDVLDLRRTVQAIAQVTGADPIAGRTFVDIGANVGTTTVPALTQFGARAVIAFEPAPENVRLLRTNIAANDLCDRVSVHACALSDAPGEAALTLSDFNSGDHRIALDSDDHTSRPSVPVMTIVFDDLVREGAVRLDEIGLVWMDVQGHEAHVLAGAASLRAREVPVVLELWPEGLQRAGRYEELLDIARTDYSLAIDVGASTDNASVTTVPSDGLGELAATYTGEAYTNIVLLGLPETGVSAPR